MKYAIVVLFLLMPGASFAAEQSVVLSVPGMNCPVCPITIKKSLKNVEGVKSVNVIYQDKIAEVFYDDQLTGIDSLQEATANVGYPSFPLKGEK